MPHPHHPAHELVDIWSVEGRFQHLVYSPKGGIEGLLIETDGIATQFVTDPQDSSLADRLAALHAGQQLVVEGCEAEPSPKDDAEHTVYRFERLVSVDGKPAKAPVQQAGASGKVVRFNYAKHGAANGVVLDSGDFVHTKPDGFARLGLQLGDKVEAEGEARPLVTGHGRVIEARSVNGKPVGPAH